MAPLKELYQDINFEDVNLFENSRGKITCMTRIVDKVKKVRDFVTGEVTSVKKQYLEYECQLVKVAKNRLNTRIEKLAGTKRPRPERD